MIDRYNRIFSLKPNLYKDGCPILVRAGAVLFDNSSGRLLVQLKLENVGSKKILAVFVNVNCFNVAKDNVESVENFQYLDLNINRNQTFGEKTPIILPDNTTRSVDITITKVIYADGEIWINGCTDYFKSLAELIGINIIGRELVKQLDREADKKRPYHNEFTYLPLQLDKFWFCACGTLNRNNEDICFHCKIEKEWIFNFTIPEVLQPLLDTYRNEQAKEKAIRDEYDRAERLKAEKEQQQLEEKHRNTLLKARKYCLIGCLLFVVVFAGVIIAKKVIIPSMQYIEAARQYNETTRQYNEAISLLANKQFDEAIEVFINLNEYGDSKEQIKIAYYNKALDLFERGLYDDAINAFVLSDGLYNSVELIKESSYLYGTELVNMKKYSEAALYFSRANDYKDAFYRKIECIITVRSVIDTNSFHTVGLKNDGTVIAVGDNYYRECDVSIWNEIVEVSAGSYATVGLKKDGTVVSIGHNNYKQCNVSDWKNIIAISTGNIHTVGLKKDGTVIAIGMDQYAQCKTSEWRAIVAISAGIRHTIGVQNNGEVIATGDNSDGQCNVSGWNDIIDVSANGFHSIGLKKDGTVVATGRNSDGQCNISDWTDIVAVSAGHYHTVGLRKDGTVVAIGSNDYGECNVSNWKDIIAISAGAMVTVGLKSDGTVIAVGLNNSGECNVSGWTNIGRPGD